jgi:hypothetical protein
MLRSVVTLLLCGALAAVQGAEVKHDAVPVWAEPTPADATQTLAVRFKPFLDVVNGCQPYTVVDAEGNIGGGLKTKGTPSAACKDMGKAQVYSRSGTHEGFHAIMYAWYMPKDSPMTGMGHRHDWENAVVWLDSAASAKVVAIAVSAHGGYKKSYPVDTNYLVDGVNMKVSYKSTWPLNHELGFTKSQGKQQPLIQWEQMTPAAQQALESADFGKAGVPFKSNFQGNLVKAFFK